MRGESLSKDENFLTIFLSIYNRKSLAISLSVFSTHPEGVLNPVLRSNLHHLEGAIISALFPDLYAK